MGGGACGCGDSPGQRVIGKCLGRMQPSGPHGQPIGAGEKGFGGLAAITLGINASYPTLVERNLQRSAVDNKRYVYRTM